MNVKVIGSVLAAAAISLGAYWYLSPYAAMHSMRSAAEARDADAFNQYVDYARLRESLKGQFAAALAGEAGKAAGSSQSGGAALGAMLGMAFMDKMIDAMVRPEVVMGLMNNAKLNGQQQAAGGPKDSSTSDVKWTFERKGMSRLIAYGAKEDETTSAASSAPEKVGFVFEREGFASWRLTEVRLPSLK